MKKVKILFLSFFMWIWVLMQKIEKRVEKLILKAISLSFLTWCFIFYAWQDKAINIDGKDFLLFTVAIVGIKSYKAVKEKMEGLE